MHVAIRRYSADAGSTDEVKQRVDENFVPIASDVPGFIAYYLLDSGDGVLASVSVFENREGVEELNKRAEDWVKETLSSLLSSSPQVTAGEVGVHETGNGAGPAEYASIRLYQINQGATHEALRQFSEGIVPTLKDQPGFVEYFGLEAESVIVAVNLFERPSEAEESNKVAAEYVEENLSSLLPLSPAITVGEVVVHNTK
jgi:hypothetical protein